MMHKIESYLNATTPRILATTVVFSLMVIGVIAAITHVIVDPVVDQQKQWCRERGYAVGGLSSFNGKISRNQVVCIDDQRRMLIPE